MGFRDSDVSTLTGYREVGIVYFSCPVFCVGGSNVQGLEVSTSFLGNICIGKLGLEQ